MDSFIQDLRFGVRSLFRSRGFTVAAALTLALGIGTGTALFTAVDALLLRPLAFDEPSRLVEIDAVLKEGPFMGMTKFSYPVLGGLREGTRTLAGVAAVDRTDLSLGGGSYAEEVPAAFVTGNFFAVLGIEPTAGRFFTEADDQPGAMTGGVVLSHRLWQRRFGGDPDAVGSTVTLNAQPVTVVAVAPEWFDGTQVNRVNEVWVPLSLQEQVVPNARTYSSMSYSLSLVGRLAEGASYELASTELSAVAARVSEAVTGPVKLRGVALREMSRIPEQMEGSVLRFVGLLTGATALLLLIAGTNVAGMLLVRSTGRQREIGIRVAMGAARARVVRQLTIEGLLLFLIGGAGGVLIAVWLTELLGAFRWPMALTLDLGVDLRVLGFALLLSLATGVVFSLAPALRSSRPDLVPALTGSAQGGGGGRSRFRSAFIVGQIAMSLMLLVGAGLSLRSLQHALSIDPGFNPDGVMVAEVDFHRQKYDDARGRILYDRIRQSVKSTPGVDAASFAVSIPLGGGGESLRVEPIGAGPELEPDFIRANTVDPDFFRTLEIPLIRGCGSTDADREGSPRVAVINQTMAERYWPGENPIGKRFQQTFSAFAMLTGDDAQAEQPIFEVVGVMPDGRYGSLREEEAEPWLFVPRAQNYRSRMLLAVRAEENPDRVAAAIRERVREIDPTLPVLQMVPLEHHIGDALLPQRIGAILTSFFGLLGLLLAGVGVYGVMAYMVSQRTREIGVRMALGARSASVLRLVMARGMLLAVAGIVLGLAAAAAATRLISGLLYGISATDPVAFAGVTLLLLGIAAIAIYLPARRAARVDPMVALRIE